MRRLVSQTLEELDRRGRYPGIREKSHGGSGVQWVELVFGKNGRVGEGLSDILDIEVRQFRDNLGRHHPIRYEINHMRNRNAKTANGCPAR